MGRNKYREQSEWKDFWDFLIDLSIKNWQTHFKKSYICQHFLAEANCQTFRGSYRNITSVHLFISLKTPIPTLIYPFISLKIISCQSSFSILLVIISNSGVEKYTSGPNTRRSGLKRAVYGALNRYKMTSIFLIVCFKRSLQAYLEVSTSTVIQWRKQMNVIHTWLIYIFYRSIYHW